MFSIVKIDSLISIGPSAEVAVFHLGGQQSGDPGKLVVPWRDVQKNPDPSALLSWHTRISKFSGREKEIAELKEWAYSEQAVSIKFIVGDGGTGKSRLAAEFATMLQKKSWSAGYLDLRKPQSFSMTKAGTLLIIDYPEEERKNVSEFLHDLSTIDKKNRLRVLFLTRQDIEPWRELIYDAKAGDLLDTYPLHLKRLEPLSAHQLYTSALVEASKSCGTTAVGLSEEALTAWLALAPENQRALFILAAAIYNATNPEDNIIKYTGKQVVESLCERELIRLRNIAEKNGLEDKYSIARILALSAFKDTLTTEDINAFDKETITLLSFPPKTKVPKLLQDAGLIAEGIVLTPKPDIFASAFVSMVLGENTEKAPEIIWLGIQSDIVGGLERLARLSYDAEMVLGLLKKRISVFFADALKRNVERCKLIYEFFSLPNMPISLVNVAVLVWQTLLKGKIRDIDRAIIYNNLSNDLINSGEFVDALKVIRRAVKINRHLVGINPYDFEQYLASSLITLSLVQKKIGNFQDALKAILESVSIYRRLVKINSTVFEPYLATSLNNLSNMLSDTGDYSKALEVLQESVGIFRRLSREKIGNVEPNIAKCLSNLSYLLNVLGEKENAFIAIQDAEKIYNHLVKVSPTRFENDYAGCLNNLSIMLYLRGNVPNALDAIIQAIEIYERLVPTNPDRFEPDLANSLNNFAAILTTLGNTPAALDAIQRAIKLYSRLAQTNPARFEPELANSYWAYGQMLLFLARKEEACNAFRVGIRLILPYTQQLTQSRFGQILETLQQAMKEAGCSE